MLRRGPPRALAFPATPAPTAVPGAPDAQERRGSPECAVEHRGVPQCNQSPYRRFQRIGRRDHTGSDTSPAGKRVSGCKPLQQYASRPAATPQPPQRSATTLRADRHSGTALRQSIHGTGRPSSLLPNGISTGYSNASDRRTLHSPRFPDYLPAARRRREGRDLRTCVSRQLVPRLCRDGPAPAGTTTGVSIPRAGSLRDPEPEDAHP